MSQATITSRERAEAVAAQEIRKDSELILRARQGDQAAFGALIERYWQSLARVVFRLTGDRQQAEDAAQEACLRAWQKLDSYKPDLSFRNWLFRIGVNAAIDMQRRRRPQTSIECIPLASNATSPESLVENHERAARVRQAVLALPPASRAVLALREYEGLSYQEIAATLDIPLGTVMSRLNYARTRLRAELQAYLEAE
ncbi:MAG TPA: sigma-70 family RNA polymerase sigma factor [Anaerolineales bacterium]|nr:sigma-70 family RNA polymerase sigma factor [Anaerolineales bacterium]